MSSQAGAWELAQKGDKQWYWRTKHNDSENLGEWKCDHDKTVL